MAIQTGQTERTAHRADNSNPDEVHPAIKLKQSSIKSASWDALFIFPASSLPGVRNLQPALRRANASGKTASLRRGTPASRPGRSHRSADVAGRLSPAI